MNKLKILTNGIIRENPVLVLVLGTCPALAVTNSTINGVGMGIAATFVLICSNVVISLLKKVIPDKVRIPCYIVIIAGFVTVVQLVLQAYMKSLYDALGIFLSLIVVNCVILGQNGNRRRGQAGDGDIAEGTHPEDLTKGAHEEEG